MRPPDCMYCGSEHHSSQACPTRDSVIRAPAPPFAPGVTVGERTHGHYDVAVRRVLNGFHGTQRLESRFLRNGVDIWDSVHSLEWRRRIRGWSDRQ